MVKGGNEFADTYYQVGKVRNWCSEDVSTSSLSHRLTKVKVATEPYHMYICLISVF